MYPKVVLKHIIFLFCYFVVQFSIAQYFVENKGQLHDQYGESNSGVNFYANYSGFRVFLNDNGFSYETIKAHPTNDDRDTAISVEFNRIDVSFFNSSFSGQIETNEIVCKEKFYRGDFFYESRSFKKVTYKNIYPKIDVVFYTNKEGFKYDFVVHSGADLNDIQLLFNSPFQTEISEEGIQIHAPLGSITEEVPYSYLLESNQEIDIRFKESQTSESEQVFQFTTPNNQNRFDETLVIDPIPNVWFSTYISGNLDEFPEDVVLDEDGDIYVVGYTNSVNNIATSGTFQGTFQAIYDVFLVKYKPDGTKIWGTYLGSESFDRAYALTYKNGYVYLCGNTFSQNFATSGVHQTVNNDGDDAFLAKFDLEGNRIWTTYYGGDDHDFAASVVVNSNNEIYITGHTSSYSNIATAGAHQESFFGVSAAFLAKFSSQGQLIWGTYYGSVFDEGYGIALDSDENIVFSGLTNSSNGIASPGAQQMSNAGGFDAFLTKFNPNGTRLWGTFFGGPADDKGYDVCVDAANNIYMVGNTSSLSGISSGSGFQLQAGSIDDGFVAKYNSNGIRLWSSYVGGSEAEYISAVDMYFDQGIVIGGKTQSNSNIATSGALSGNLAGQYDAFLMKLSPNGALEWGSYFGGSQSDEFTGLAIDLSNGYIHTAGLTLSDDGIATPDAYQTTPGSGLFHGFLARFCAPLIPNFITEIQAVSCGSTNYSVDVESPNVFTDFVWHDATSNPFYNFTDLAAGQYYYFLSTIDTNNCSFSTDTVFFQVLPDVVLDLEILYDQSVPFCQGSSVTFFANDNFQDYVWSNGTTTHEATFLLDDLGEHFITLSISDSNGCVAQDTLFFEVLESPQPFVQISGAANFCLGELVTASTSEFYFAFSWHNGDTSPQTTISEDSWVWVLATNELGCTAASDSVFVSSTELTPTIVLINSLPLCPNSILNFEMNNIFNSYEWSTGQTTASVEVLALPGEQWISVEVENLCGGVGVDTLFYSVSPQIGLSMDATIPELLCIGSQLNASVSGAFSDVLWQNSISGSAYDALATEFGIWSITVEALDENLCPVYDTLSLEVDSCFLVVGTESIQWRVFPNPVHDELTIQSYAFTIGNIELLDARGNLVELIVFNNNFAHIKMENYSAGIYFLKIYNTTDQFIGAERIVKSGF